MEIDGVKIVPGCIIDIDDDKKIGRVKCDVPTLFVSSEMNKDGMPWIYPLVMPGYQRFSMPVVGQKVWVIQNTKNYNEFWYVPMQDLTGDVKGLVQTDDDYETSDIVLARNIGALGVFIYYIKSQGLMLRIGDSTLMNITDKGEIHLQAATAKVELKNNKVYIGDGSDGEAAVKGDTLKSLLEDLSNKISTASLKALNSPYTIHMAKPLSDCSKSIDKFVNKILCEYTNVN